MTMTRWDILDRSVEKSRVCSTTSTSNSAPASPARLPGVRAFLHALRDYLFVDEAAQLAAQLPIFVRGLFYEGWDPSRTPERARDIDSFLRRIAGEALLAGETEASVAAVAASRVLSRHISPGETESVLRTLPEQLRELLTPNEG